MWLFIKLSTVLESLHNNEAAGTNRCFLSQSLSRIFQCAYRRYHSTETTLTNQFFWCCHFGCRQLCFITGSPPPQRCFWYGRSSNPSEAATNKSHYSELAQKLSREQNPIRQLWFLDVAINCTFPLPREQEKFFCHRMLHRVIHYIYHLHISKMVTHMDNLVNFFCRKLCVIQNARWPPMKFEMAVTPNLWLQQL